MARPQPLQISSSHQKEHDPTGFSLAPRTCLVDAAGLQPVGCLRRQQDMVDADAVVALPGAEIIPEGVLAAFGMQGAEGVGIAQIFDPPQRRPGFRLEQRVLQPGLGSWPSLSSGMTL